MTASYTYDFADRQESLEVTVDGGGPQPVASGAIYKLSGPLASLDLGNGLVETRGFNQRYFPDSIAVAGGELDRSWIYATDSVGNITRIDAFGACPATLTLENQTLEGTLTFEACQEIIAGPDVTIASEADVTFRARERVVLANGFAVENDAHFRVEIDPSIEPVAALVYGYQDHQYFLETASGPWGELGWTYDRIGNRLTEERNGETDAYNYVPNGAGNTPILKSVSLFGSGSREYEFGLAGHLEQIRAGANILDFSSDDAGRLSSIDREGESVGFTYDGRSFLECVDSPAGNDPDAATVEPVYSSEGLIRSLTRKPLPPEPEQSFQFFYFAGRPIAQLKRVDGGSDTWTFLTTDHLGTPLLATDLAGTEIWTGPFEPFGEDPFRGTSAGALENDLVLRFPGQWEDPIWQAATEGVPLYYNVHRWYEYAIERYATPDPLGIIDGGPHLYSYALSNPLGTADPLGLVAQICCRLLNHMYLGQKLKKRHCYLIADDGTKYGLYPGSRAGHRVGIPRPNDPRDKGGVCQGCPSDCTQGDQNQCLRRASEEYPIGLYGELSTNSNTFAGTLARACCAGGVPSGLGDTPGINREPPKPLGPMPRIIP